MSDETHSFGARMFVAYATIVAKMSRYHEIGTTGAIGLARLPTLGLLFIAVSDFRFSLRPFAWGCREQRGCTQCEAIALVLDPLETPGCSLRLRWLLSWLAS
jgi:hypothetical protein